MPQIRHPQKIHETLKSLVESQTHWVMTSDCKLGYDALRAILSAVRCGIEVAEYVTKTTLDRSTIYWGNTNFRLTYDDGEAATPLTTIHFLAFPRWLMAKEQLGGFFPAAIGLKVFEFTYQESKDTPMQRPNMLFIQSESEARLPEDEILKGFLSGILDGFEYGEDSKAPAEAPDTPNAPLFALSGKKGIA